MRAMVLHIPGQPLQREERPIPTPGPHQLLIKVLACGVCRTDLHLVDGELPQAVLPRVPGHEIVGEVTAVGADVAARLDRPAGGRSVAWLDLRSVRVLPFGPGESLRSGAVHRLSSGRRLRRIHRCRRAFLLPDPRGALGHSSGTAAVCRADRLSGVANGQRRTPPGPLWFRRGGASGDSGGAGPRAEGVCLHPTG